ncbi:MAG: hypothetical protein ACLRSW_06880 [Christensenellaceae bacterium]
MFFGLHPLVNALQLKFKVKRWIAAVKAVWFDASMFRLAGGDGMAALGWSGESVYHSHSPHRRYGIFFLRLYDFLRRFINRLSRIIRK